MTCPLCLKDKSPLFYSQTSGVNWELYDLNRSTDKPLNFYQCSQCDLIFKDPAVLLGANSEKSRYDLHNNNPNDPNYDAFLSTLVDPLLKLIKPDALGLDFGCGREKAIENLFKKKKISCASYDPYFFNNPELLTKKYDFITVCETAEHFYQPKKEFELLFGLLKPRGYLAVKTGLVPKDFASWWYHKDPTHVVFYSAKTFQFIAKKYATQVEFYPKDVAIVIARA